MGLLVPPLRAVTICLNCLEFKSGLIWEDDDSPWCVVAAMVFRQVLPCSSVSSEPAGGAGSGLVGLGALCSVKTLYNPSSKNDRSTFSARESNSFSLLVSVLSVC